MTSFIDRVTVHVTGGTGGNGCVSIKREKFKPLAGPDGGKGGHGGSIIARVDGQESTLLPYHYSPHLKAKNGTPGMGDFRDGKNGEDLIISVPKGTVIKDEDGNILADLSHNFDEFPLATGGVGGYGNARLASAKRKAPGFALLGEPGQTRSLVLELKSIADVALVGFPSCGKSSLIAAASAARPKIADYPFTTLVPNLGVVEAGNNRYTMADVPGLIPGAAQGKGLGLDFLRHIERCSVIVHVLDCAVWEAERNPIDDIIAIEAELAQYSSDLDSLDTDEATGRLPLMKRPRVIVLNKVDLQDAQDLAQMVSSQLRGITQGQLVNAKREIFTESKAENAEPWQDDLPWKDKIVPVFEISALTHKGLDKLCLELGRLVAALRPSPDACERPVLKPGFKENSDHHTFSIIPAQTEHGPGFQVLSQRLQRWVVQTDFANEEAVGYLADRLNQAGVEQALAKAGAKPGDPVVIGSGDKAVVFDWEPTMSAGAELLGARGTDLRLQESNRISRAQKRAQYYEMMDAKAEARAGLEEERRAGIWTDPAKE